MFATIASAHAVARATREAFASEPDRDVKDGKLFVARITFDELPWSPRQLDNAAHDLLEEHPLRELATERVLRQLDAHTVSESLPEG